MEQNSATSLKQLFQGMTPDGIEFLQGKVVQTSPIKIQVTNDEKLVLTDRILIVPRHLSDYSTTATITTGNGTTIDAETEGNGEHGEHEGGGTGTHEHHLVTFSLRDANITVHNALKAGEIVHLLSLNNGKKYYVLDRVVR